MGAASTELSAPRRVAAVAAVLLAPWLYRLLALGAAPRDGWGHGLRGFVADAAVASLTLAVLLVIARLSRWLAAGLGSVLALGYYANFETITSLGMIASPLDLQYFDDLTFVRGSALALAQPAALAFGVLGTFALAAWGLRGARLRDALAPLVVGAFLLGASLVWSPQPALEAWRQENALAYNADWLTSRAMARDPEGFATSLSAMRDLVPAVGGDLDAPPAFEFDGRGKNVLLVVLESVSGAYLQSAAEHHGRDVVNAMPRLARIFDQNVGYATFFTHNRRTNRGLYTLLCGEYPRLTAGTPKMAVAAGRPWRHCLPEALRVHGYRTVYLQSAPLAFMQKDSFMPAIGFDETLGDPWFQRSYHRTEWGVDDRAFLEQSLAKIDELRASGQPWFLTLLNAGTHHPFVVPPSYESPFTTPVRQAFAYLDEALGGFLRVLEARGLRDDTLILFTSDESRGDFGRAAGGAAGQMSENWGFLIALLPEREQRLVGDVYAQSDLPLSILDYLGMDSEGYDFFGRSAFRAYDRGRVLFFGNLNHRMVGGLKPDDSVTLCEREGRVCARYRDRKGRIFAPRLDRVRSDTGFANIVREMGQRSLPPTPDSPLVVPLIVRPVVEVAQTNWLWVQGVSQLALDPSEWVEVDMEVESRGPAPVTLLHTVKVGGERVLLNARALLAPGQTLAVRYTLASDIPVTRSSIRTRTRLPQPGRAELVFRKRRFEIKRGAGRPPEGVTVSRVELDPPAEHPFQLEHDVTPIAQYADYLRWRESRGYAAEEELETEEDDGA